MAREPLVSMLEEFIAEMNAVRISVKPLRYHEADRKFHEAIVTATRLASFSPVAAGPAASDEQLRARRGVSPVQDRDLRRQDDHARAGCGPARCLLRRRAEQRHVITVPGGRRDYPLR
jgi:DNA-binding GntR family transcriptional regulator